MKRSLPLFFGDTARGVAIHLPCGQLMLARAISNRSFMLFGGPLGGFSWAHRPLYFSQLAAPPRPGQAVPGPPSAPVTPRARPRRRGGDGHKHEWRCRRGLQAETCGTPRISRRSSRFGRHAIMAPLTQEMVTMQTQLTAIIEREARGYASFCPELDIASQGDTIEEARDNLREALELFFESASPAEIQERRHAEIYVTRVDVAIG